MDRLKGRVALVTGAARGIGRVSARMLAEAGAEVGVADILPEVEKTCQEVRATGHRSAAAIFDVSDPEGVGKGVERIRRELGEIEVLVNNAGIVNNIAPLTRMSFVAWSRELSVNLTGMFNMIQEVIGPMICREWGRIINISSGAATGGLHNQAAYAASKAGILGLTKTVTLEYARKGISCNAILPGMIETELVSAMPQEIRERSIALTPARRMGKMEEVGDLIVFLASDGAAFINGAEIHIDGGMRLNTAALGSRKESSRID